MKITGRAGERIRLQRYDIAAKDWLDLPNPMFWAQSIDPLGEDRFRIRMRFRSDLRVKADIAPAMRILRGDRVLIVDDVTEPDPQKEINLLAHQVLVEQDNIEAGVKEITVWP